MPQQDNYIEQIHRLEGLMAYAESHGDWEELERLLTPSAQANPADATRKSQPQLGDSPCGVLETRLPAASSALM